MPDIEFPRPGLTLTPPDCPAITLERPLGAGAFGVVFQAVTGEGERVAVKFPQGGLFGSDVEIRAFLNEMAAAQQISHPHVLRVLSVDVNPTRVPPYLVLEFADGGTLKERLEDAKKGPRPVQSELVLGWGLELVSAMAEINRTMLHRDLKPDNILFCDGVLKVADFGLSKLVSAATRTQTFKGGQHVLYMAPEAWLGEKNTLQVDMYALGIVLFEIACLAYPYKLPADISDFAAVRDMHLYQAPLPIARFRTDLPQRFADTTAKLLSKRPADRYSDWAAVEAAIRAATAGHELDPTLARAVAAAAEKHRAAAEAAAKAAAAREDASRARALDEYQRDLLKDRLKAVVQTFNAQSELVKIAWKEIGSDAVEIYIPDNGYARIDFFHHAPFDTQPGEVRYSARVNDGRGCGFNFLLRRIPATDLYGEWVVCRVRANPLTSHHRGDCKYFGLSASEIEHIGRGIRAMHVVVPEFGGDVEQVFRELLLSVIQD